MRFAKRVLFCALATLMLCAVALAQTPRSESDPRNQSPAVGTGGTVGGPTGLFTVYDGSTLRRGEWTFSIAYSNYDRDPGDADFTDIPASFNVGLNNHIELFFKVNAWRGVKVNSLRNLSGAYLPNIAFGFPAIVAPPLNFGSITTSGLPLFRPAGNQPFVQYPFPGNSAGAYGQAGFFTPTLGVGVGGSGGNFGSAALYPGIGSTVGGILPGIVLQTTVLPATALTLPITVPSTFTIAPSYLPDAPFLSRSYGDSSFTDWVVGAKIRLTGPNNPLGVGIIPFYRWYNDKGDNVRGFTHLQRGASTGGNIGDFGLIGFIDGRISKHVNLSANVGYVVQSNPKDPAGATLLDIPNLFLSGVAVDFPVNKHFQPILELSDTRYVSGRTPNAFQNNPLDFVMGAKVYPRRWFGFGIAYRRHLNEQNQERFFNEFRTQVNQLSGVFVPGRGIVIVPGTTVGATTGGLPNGFRFSDDPNGFIIQAFAGHREAREPEVLPNRPPVIASFTASTTSITLPCPPGQISATCPTTANMSVQLATSASDPDGDTLLYTYTTTGGRISGEGPNVTWDLTGATPGTYSTTVEVDDGCGCITFSTVQVTIAACTDCKPPCPTINISCPTDVIQEGTSATVSVNVSGGVGTPTYNWSVSAGTISSGQGTSSITVNTAGQAGQSITATVELGGLDPSCSRTASCTFSIAQPPKQARKFDEYGNIRFNDEKARLDNYAIQLQNEPGSQGVIIAYGSCDGEAIARANRAKDYLVNTRGIDASRLTTVDGGCQAALKVELWIVPQGAAAPTPDTSANISPCPACKKKPTVRHRTTRRRRGEEEEQ
jgi:hypothetical protein